MSCCTPVTVELPTGPRTPGKIRTVALVGPLDTGSACGLNSGASCDLEAATVQNAVIGGMTVVVAAGNQGSTGSFTNTGSGDRGE